MPWLIILLIALLLALTVLKFRQLRQERRRQENMAPALRELLPHGVAAGQRMMLYFYNQHCGSCRSVTPLIEDLYRRGAEVVTVDVRRHLLMARRFGIRATPSVVVLERGQIACVHVGAISGAALQQLYEGCRMQPLCP
ncbi:MAG TPA: thioredoxin family protein [Gammaproteobacteria bacterium]|jgi:thiol-disulfide isomerase/thioredoxin